MPRVLCNSNEEISPFANWNGKFPTTICWAYGAIQPYNKWSKILFAHERLQLVHNCMFAIWVSCIKGLLQIPFQFQNGAFPIMDCRELWAILDITIRTAYESPLSDKRLASHGLQWPLRESRIKGRGWRYKAEICKLRCRSKWRPVAFLRNNSTALQLWNQKRPNIAALHCTDE